MTIEYSDDRQVWKNGDIAIAYEMLKLGFTEYTLNSRGDVNAKVELDLLGGMVKVVLSYIPVEGSVHINDSRTNTLLWSADSTLDLERSAFGEFRESKENIEQFVRSKVQEVLLSHIREEQNNEKV